MYPFYYIPGLLQLFVKRTEEVTWQPYLTLPSEQKFSFTAFMGFKLRVLPLLKPAVDQSTGKGGFVHRNSSTGSISGIERYPLQMRGITVKQLQDFQNQLIRTWSYTRCFWRSWRLFWSVRWGTP